MLVLHAGAFVAVERGDRDVAALVKRERLAGWSPRCGAAPAGGRSRSRACSLAWTSRQSMTRWGAVRVCCCPAAASPRPLMPRRYVWQPDQMGFGQSVQIWRRELGDVRGSVTDGPDGTDRQRCDPVAQGKGVGAGVEDHSADEPVAELVAHPGQVPGVGRRD
jgi:hypothetical protein